MMFPGMRVVTTRIKWFALFLHSCEHLKKRIQDHEIKVHCICGYFQFLLGLLLTPRRFIKQIVLFNNLLKNCSILMFSCNHTKSQVDFYLNPMIHEILSITILALTTLIFVYHLYRKISYRRKITVLSDIMKYFPIQQLMRKDPYSPLYGFLKWALKLTNQFISERDDFTSKKKLLCGSEINLLSTQRQLHV